MRFIAAILFTTLVACAHNAPTAGPVNVAAVRHEIADSLHGERTILSMGHVDHAHAVVFTKDATNARHEETWVRAGEGWKLDQSVATAP